MKDTFETLERFFRQYVIYPLLRVIFRNSVSTGPVDLKRVQKLLIFRYDRIGDMIVTSPILRLLKGANSRIRLDVLASEVNAEILQHNPLVDNLLVLETNWFRVMRQVIRLRRERYDVVINFIFNRTTGPAILANLIAPRGYKVGQGPDRYAFYFNRLLKVSRFEQHMLESYVSMTEQAFGISVDREQLMYEIAVDSESRKRVDEWLATQSLHRRSYGMSPGLPYVVLNPSGKDEDRSLGVGQVAALAKSLSARSRLRLVVLDSPGNPAMSEAIREKAEFRNALVYRTLSSKPLHELASLIEGALLAISPDTSIVHFASAMKTPVLAVYAPMNASQEWLPYKVPYDLVMATGAQRVFEIPPEAIVERAERFVGRVIDNGGMQTSESA